MGQHSLTAYSSSIGAHLLQFKVIWGSETLSQKGSMGRGRMENGWDERREGESRTILLQSANLHVIMFPAESFCACTEGAVSWFSERQPCGCGALPQVCLSLCSLLESPADRFSLVCTSSSVLKPSSSLTCPILSIRLELILLLMCFFMMGGGKLFGFCVIFVLIWFFEGFVHIWDMVLDRLASNSLCCHAWLWTLVSLALSLQRWIMGVHHHTQALFIQCWRTEPGLWCARQSLLTELHPRP